MSDKLGPRIIFGQDKDGPMTENVLKVSRTILQ